METIFFKKTSELKRHKTELEKKLNVKITIVGKKVTIVGKKVTVEGSTVDEYEASIVLDAVNFGFPAQTALLLKDDDVVFRKISIKNFTRRKDLEVVKSRIIGAQGSTKNTIEQIADCKVVVNDNEVGILCEANEIEYAITALTNLIRGSKQSNVYKFLERINTQKKKNNNV